MLSQVYLLLLLLLSSWVAASPALPNPRSYPQPTPHPSPLEKRDDGDVTFPASRCDSPCIVNFFPVTTVLTISAPTQTVWVSIFKEFVTFNFPAITTSTVLQPSAQTFINNDPVATPTITLSPAEVGVLTIFGNEDTHAYHHYESIAMFLNYMVVDDGPVEYRELQYTQYNLNNDCALITMAYLMEISLQDLLTYTGLAPPGADRDGLFPAEIQLWLHHTGRNYAITPYSYTPEKDLNYMMNGLGVKKLGACFRRHDLTGHCVVWENDRFWDFQTADAPFPYIEEAGVPVTDYLIQREYILDNEELELVVPYIFCIY